MTRLPSGTVTFLFTDIEGSTQLWDSFPEEMRAALRIHNDIVIQAVEGRGGHLVKNTGDGMFAAFSTAAEGVGAAIDIQRRLATVEWDAAIQSLEVRVALHTDEATPEENDYHGTAVNRVARIEAAGHGGQILMSDATATLASQDLPEDVSTIDLGMHLLRGLSSPERIHQLVVPELREVFPPLRSATTATFKLPEFPTSFVGRGRELEDLSAMASDPANRVLTLVGPGGIGKTRLAVETARRSAEEVRAVAHFLPLGSLTSIDAVVNALAESLEFTIDFNVLSPRNSERDQVFARLAMHPAILVLDNYEHLIEHAGFVADLVAQVPTTTAIVTSRERLAIQGEWVYEVDGLGGETEERSEAAALFVERAVQAGGSATEDDSEVRRICQLVGGMPLAIEMAAAWASVLSPTEIASEIQERIDFLATQVTDVPARHRSVRAAFDSSWGRLDKSSREALAKLAVFPAAFTREAAESITGTTLPRLFDLVKRSLLRRDGLDHFDLHPMVREFAAEQLGDTLSDLVEAHARHYASFLLDHSDALAGSLDQVAERDLVASELDHVLASVRWHIEQGEDEAVPLLDGLHYFYFLHSWNEGAEEMGRLANLVPGDGKSPPMENDTYRRARLHSIDFAHHLNEPQPLHDELLRLLPHCEQAGGVERSICTVLLGGTAIVAGQTDTSIEWFDRAHAMDVELDPLTSITLYAWHGWALVLDRRPEEARAVFAEGERRARHAGADLGRAFLLSKLGVASDETGDHVAAAGFHRQAEEVFIKFGDVGGQAYVAIRLSWTSYLSGNYELALRYALNGLEKFETINHTWGMAASRCRAALAEIELGEVGSALSRLGEALEMARDAGMREVVYYSLTGIGRVWLAKGRDREAAMLLKFVDTEGNPYRAFAVSTLDQLGDRLHPSELEAAAASAEELDLDHAVALART